MNTFRVLASPRVWGPVLVVVTVLALIFYAYLAAVTSPQENIEDLPVALVNEDRGADLAGEKANLGDRIVEKVTDPESPAAGTVDWIRPDTREDALDGIGNNEYYGAIVIPKNYSQRISDLASPPTIPIAVLVEDQGAVINGQPMKLGEEVAKMITAPDSPAPDFVKWARLDGRDEAMKGLESGNFYAAIVIPGDYSQQLLSMSGPPAVPPSGQPPALEPAGIELLTSPAVRPSTTSLIENAFNGMVGGISGATSERMLGVLSEQGMTVPPGAAAMISDPVKGIVSEADVSDVAGPLPQAPEPAEIEVLTNPSAGPAVATPVQNISTGIVHAVSQATSERIAQQAGDIGAQLPPEVAAVVGDPVRADITEAQPVGPDSGNGQSPFFLAFLANLSGLIGGAVVFFLIREGAERLEARGIHPSRTGVVDGASSACVRLRGARSRSRAVGSLRSSRCRTRGEYHAGLPVPRTRHYGGRNRDHALRCYLRARGHRDQRRTQRNPRSRLLRRRSTPGGAAALLSGLRRLAAHSLRHRRPAITALLQWDAGRSQSRRWLERFPLVPRRWRALRSSGS